MLAKQMKLSRLLAIYLEVSIFAILSFFFIKIESTGARNIVPLKKSYAKGDMESDTGLGKLHGIEFRKSV